MAGTEPQTLGFFFFSLYFQSPCQVLWVLFPFPVSKVCEKITATRAQYLSNTCLLWLRRRSQISVSGVRAENATRMSHRVGRHGACPLCTSFPSAFREMAVYYEGLCLLFLIFHCLMVFFLPTLNCTKQDILFSNGETKSALINGLCYFYGINRMLSLYWNTVRTRILCAVRKNRPKLYRDII